MHKKRNIETTNVYIPKQKKIKLNYGYIINKRLSEEM